MLKDVRDMKPMVHCITSPVTAYAICDILACLGVRTFMAEEVEEIEDMTAGADGLMLNMGMWKKEKLNSMILAGKVANTFNHPIVLDPVGIGTSSLRRTAALELLSTVSVTAIRGNYKEILALQKNKKTMKGIDGENNLIPLNEKIQLAKEVAKQFDTIIVLSGKKDILTDGTQTYLLENGCASMAQIVGTGCQSSAIITAFLAAKKSSPLYAALYGLGSFTIAGEMADLSLRKGEGLHSLAHRMSDIFYCLDDKEWEAKIRYEVIF
ncbi:MAG: hydroxyethylthiazole kinase [Tissierellia bacterium]|nr:hydroxyethylthiazole kinase [Tissierellia bacterium]